MSQLSNEEFHRMQLQIIELRTENYKLIDETKKQAYKISDLTEREAKLDKELKTLTKMKRALSTLNKSKQAQEFEQLLRQTEEEFSLQNQTLNQEMMRMSTEINKLEKENKSLKAMSSGCTNSDIVDENEFRKIKAENSALKSKIENLHLQHDRELKLVKSELKSTDCEGIVEDQLLDKLHLDNINDQTVHLQAQCERYKEELKLFQDLQVKYETSNEERRLLEEKLNSLRDKEASEQKVLTNEIETIRNKFDAATNTITQLENNKKQLEQEVLTLKSEIKLIEETNVERHQVKQNQLHQEINSLGKALQSSQNMIDHYQVAAANQEEEILNLKKNLEEKMIEKENLIQKQSENDQIAMKLTSSEQQNGKLRQQLEKMRIEKEEATKKFEENARASGELLQRMDKAEEDNVHLLREIEELKQLAEKRKQVMDKQAIDSQEYITRFDGKMKKIQIESEEKLKVTTEDYEKKLGKLEERCGQQEKELFRVNQRDRKKTRELDSVQQEIRDLKTTLNSVESSKGWFERALKDCEDRMKEQDEEHEKRMKIKEEEHLEDIQKINLICKKKDEEMSDLQKELDKNEDEKKNHQKEVTRLQQDIKDGIDHQKMMEKKGLSTLKDLKRQLVNERKKNEKLQVKLKEISSNHSNLDELLQVVDQSNLSKTNSADGGSSVSSFSFRDLIPSSSHPKRDHSISSESQITEQSLQSSPIVSPVNKQESKDLLNRITLLQQEKWSLEERVRHLEASASGMAEELLEKTRLMQDYVKNTRTDASTRTRGSHEELASRKFSDRVRSIITGQEDADVINIRELNRKLTRMLEEEMTKNMMLKEDLISMTNQLSEYKK